MPRIPGFQPQQLGSQAPRPAPTAENFGATRRAVENLGIQGAEFATGLLQKRKRARDEDFVFQRGLEDRQAIAEREIELKKEFGNDPEGFSREMKGFLDDRFQTNQRDAPSQTAKRNYQRKSGDLFNTSIIRASAFENTRKAELFSENIINSFDDLSTRMVVNPDDQSASEELRFIEGHIQSNSDVIGPAVADALIERGRESVARAVLNGHLQRREFDTGIGLIEGGARSLEVLAETPARIPIKDAIEIGLISEAEGADLRSQGKTSILQAMGPDEAMIMQNFDQRRGITTALSSEEQASFLGKFKRGISVREGERISDLNASMNDWIAVSLTTGDPDVERKDALVSRVKANPNLTQESKTRSIAKLNAIEVTARSISEAKTSSRADMFNLINEFDSSFNAKMAKEAAEDPAFATVPKAAQEAQRIKAKAQFTKGINDLIKQQEKDSADYVNRNFNSELSEPRAMMLAGDPVGTQNYLDLLRQKYDQIGIPGVDRRTLSKPDAEAFGNQILANKDPVTASNTIERMRGQFGMDLGGAMDDMIQDRVQVGGTRFDERFRMAAWTPDSVARQEMLDNIFRGNLIEADFKQQKQSLDSAAVRSLVNSSVAGFSDAFDDAQFGTEIKNGVIEQITLQAMKTGTPVSSDAVDAATNLMLGRSFQAIDGGNSSIFAPLQIGARPITQEFVEDWLQTFSSREGFNELGIPVPPQFEGNKEAFYLMLEERGRWATNGSVDGVVLKMADPQTATDFPVVGVDGKQFQIRFQDMFDDAEKLEEAKVERIRGQASRLQLRAL